MSSDFNIVSASPSNSLPATTDNSVLQCSHKNRNRKRKIKEDRGGGGGGGRRRNDTEESCRGRMVGESSHIKVHKGAQTVVQTTERNSERLLM